MSVRARLIPARLPARRRRFRYGLYLLPEKQEQTLSTAAPARFRFYLENRSDRALEVSLALSGLPLAWLATVEREQGEGAWLEQALLLEPDVRVPFLLVVHPPRATREARIAVTLKATSLSDPSSSASGIAEVVVNRPATSDPHDA